MGNADPQCRVEQRLLIGRYTIRTLRNGVLLMECCLATWFEPIRPLCVSMLVVLCILVCVAFDGLADGMPSFGSNSSINALKRARPNGSAVAVHDQAGTIQKVKKKAPKPVILTYSDEENIVRRVSVSWGDFINAAPAAPRTKPYIKSSALKALQQCTAPNASPTCKEVLLELLQLMGLVLLTMLAAAGTK